MRFTFVALWLALRFQMKISGSARERLLRREAHRFHWIPLQSGSRELLQVAVGATKRGSNVAAIRRHRFMVPDDLVVGKCAPELRWRAGCPLRFEPCDQGWVGKTWSTRWRTFIAGCLQLQWST